MRITRIAILASCIGFYATQAGADVGSPEHGPREGYGNSETKANGEAKTKEILEKNERHNQRMREIRAMECEMHRGVLEAFSGKKSDIDCDKLRNFSIDDIPMSDEFKKYRKSLASEIENMDADTLRAKLPNMNRLTLKIALETINRDTLRNAVAAMDRKTYQAGLESVDKPTSINMEKFR